MENDSANNRMSFVLPANYQVTDLPNPNDPNIMLHYSAEGYFACLSFGGYTNAKRIKEKESELKVRTLFKVQFHYSFAAGKLANS
jgi:hypothetical protein